MSRRQLKRERGVTLVMVALFIVVLFAMAALAIDLGVLYTARTSAQHAADAAALAGAYSFLIPNASQPAAAQNAAVSIAATNKILGTPVSITPANVSVDTVNRRVTVTVARTAGNGVATFFAKVIGINSANVQTQATAEASLKGTGSRCVKPFFLPNTILATPAAACGYTQTVFDKSGNPTAFAISDITSLAASQTPLGIRPTTPNQALTPSQFYSLDFGAGAATYSCTIGSCLNDCGITSVKCGDAWPVETGNMVGPTNQGVTQLIGSPPDRFLNIGEYQTSSGPSDSSQSLVIAPIWDNCTQSISSGTAGQKINIIGFLELFVVGMNGNTVNVFPIQPIACSTQGGNPGPGTGPMAVPVRLVQTP